MAGAAPWGDSSPVRRDVPDVPAGLYSTDLRLSKQGAIRDPEIDAVISKAREWGSRVHVSTDREEKAEFFDLASLKH